MSGTVKYAVLAAAGTGKTLLARAVAHHTDCTFIRVSGSELVQKYIGEVRRATELIRRISEHVFCIWPAVRQSACLRS